MKINPLYKLGLKKLDDDSFLEIIKNVRPKDISTLCAVNKDFAERCKKYNKHICRSVLKNLGFKDLGSIDPCELYKFIKNADSDFNNQYLLYAHAILQNKPEYIELFNKQTKLESSDAENIGEWIDEILTSSTSSRYLPINIDRSFTFKIGDEDFDFTTYIFTPNTIIQAIKNNKQDDVFEMLEHLQNEQLPIHHEYNDYLNAAKSNKELYNKLKQYYADIDVYSDDDDDY